MNDSPQKAIRSKARTVLAVFFATMLVMTLYESAKQIMMGEMNLWVSHAITIVFTSIMSASVAWLISDRLQSYYSRIKEVELREERLNTHRAMMYGTSHYLNNMLNILQLVKFKVEETGTIDPEMLNAIDDSLHKMKQDIQNLGMIDEPTKDNIEKFVNNNL